MVFIAYQIGQMTQEQAEVKKELAYLDKLHFNQILFVLPFLVALHPFTKP